MSTERDRPQTIYTEIKLKIISPGIQVSTILSRIETLLWDFHTNITTVTKIIYYYTRISYGRMGLFFVNLWTEEYNKDVVIDVYLLLIQNKCMHILLKIIYVVKFCNDNSIINLLSTTQCPNLINIIQINVNMFLYLDNLNVICTEFNLGQLIFYS